jgi:[ribosomal protein S18]-alanine N-acetyltransferase
MNNPAGGIRIQSMIDGDLDPVIRIADSHTGAPHWPRSAYLVALRPESTPQRLALVATGPAQDRVLGFIVASLLPPQAELESIAIAPDSLRRGVGRQLVEALRAELSKSAISTIALEVRASNLTALAFYRSLGFVQTGRRPHYYADPIEDAVLMELRLG